METVVKLSGRDQMFRQPGINIRILRDIGKWWYPTCMISCLILRYLKLVVSRIGTSELDTSGSLLINEIEFYEGYLSQIEIPSKSSKLLSPRTPSPLRVLCSSFTDQDHHCYKAFDGDTSPGSYWRTKPVGEHRNQISSEAWILLDLGIGENSLSRDIDIGRRMRPTAMKIVCGVGSSLAGCPMTFALYGSNEPYSNFELIVAHDSYDFNASDYASGGKLFNFYEDTPYGRAIGQRCGSCDRHPRYMCAKGAFDTSCESMFCTSEGVCGEPEPCPIGQYSSMQFIGDGLPQFSCHFCPAGKYGNISGLMSQYCAGECDAGCYCNSGSTQSCQYKCGAPSYFCPKGSSQPLLAGAGMKTVDAFGNNEDNSLEMRVSVLPCSLGHYCQGGVERKCPAGTFGSDTMLSSPACSGDCQPGYYCPAGTVNPIKCPLGHYCADGIAKVPCPAGSYGSIEGLRDRECSGKCQPGFYCLSGSKSPQERQCPKGFSSYDFSDLLM